MEPYKQLYYNILIYRTPLNLTLFCKNSHSGQIDNRKAPFFSFRAHFPPGRRRLRRKIPCRPFLRPHPDCARSAADPPPLRRRSAAATAAYRKRRSAATHCLHFRANFPIFVYLLYAAFRRNGHSRFTGCPESRRATVNVIHSPCPHSAATASAKQSFRT